MKITGAELKAFSDEGWPEPVDDWFWDHEEFDGDPEPGEVYDTEAIGPILFQGRGGDPTNGGGYDLAACIRKWRKNRDCEILTVRVPKKRLDEVRKALVAMKLKVVA